MERLNGSKKVVSVSKDNRLLPGLRTESKMTPEPQHFSQKEPDRKTEPLLFQE